MSLSTLPLPSISLVLTSNLPYIPTPAPAIDRDQGSSTSPKPQVDSERGNDQHATQTSESPKKRKQWLHVLRRRHESSVSSVDSTSFFSNAVRRLVSARAGTVFFRQRS